MMVTRISKIMLTKLKAKALSFTFMSSEYALFT